MVQCQPVVGSCRASVIDAVCSASGSRRSYKWRIEEPIEKIQILVMVISIVASVDKREEGRDGGGECFCR